MNEIDRGWPVIEKGSSRRETRMSDQTTTIREIACGQE
jgi:hypothetical protein